MATIPGGLSQTTFVTAITNNPQMSSMTFGLLPTGSNISYSQLNPIQQLFAGMTYNLYESLGGSTVVGGMSASNLATFQAFTQYYSLLFYQTFGPLIATSGTSFSV